jgi:hypothetical protein
VKLFRDSAEIPAGLRRAYLLVLAPLAVVAPIPLFWTDGALPLALAAYEIAIVILWWRARSGNPIRLSDAILNAIGLSYFLWLGLEVAILRHSLIRSVSHLLLFTAVAKLASLKRPGEARTALLVLFLLTLAAASSSTHVASLLYFAVMAFLSFRTLGRLAVLADFDDAPPDRVLSSVPTGGIAFAVIAAAGLLTAPLFYSLPRLRSPFMTAPVRVEDALSSALAADRVDLDSFGSAKRSDRVVLRMDVSPDRARPRALRLREAVFTDYADGVWTRNPRTHGVPSPHRPRRDSASPETHPGESMAGDVSIDLNPFVNGFLFLPYGATNVELDRGYPVTLADGIVRLPTNRRAVRYTARIRIAEPRGIGATAIDPATVPKPIREYAMRLTGDLQDPAAIYRRIRDHFEKDFVYTLDPPRAPGGDPIAHFLVSSKAGHCEFFASAAALMLTARGIPARLVTGSYGGETGLFSSAIVVRGTNLHAWVEAEIDGTGFSVLDPTPASGIPAAMSRASFWQRATSMARELEFFYDRRILGFDAFDQVQFIEAARQSLHTAADAAGEGNRLWKAHRREIAGSAVGIAALVGLIGLLRRRRTVRLRMSPATRAYIALRRLLARRVGGLAPSVPPAEVARLFAAAAPDSAEDANTIVDVYCADRFGGRETDVETQADVKRRLRRLRKLA